MGKDLGTGTVITAQKAYHLEDGDRITAPVVSSAGVLGVHSGGTATNIVESGGLVIVETGGTATFAPTTFSDLTLSSASNLGAAIHTATVHSGTTANRNTLSAGYVLDVYSGGTANSTTVKYGCLLRVLNGGQANDNVLEAGGSFYVSNGGVANRTSGGFGYVFTGGTVNSTTVTHYLLVHEGATANSTTIKTGSVIVDGDAYDTTISGGSMEVFSGARAFRTTVNGGFLDVSSGGSASSATVFAGGSMQVFSSGVANKVHLSGGRMMVSFGGIANSATVSDGKLYVDGVANNAKVSGGSMDVISAEGAASAGTASNTTVANGGQIHIRLGGSATNTKIADNGSMFVYSGGTADKTSMTGAGAYLEIGENGTATSTTATDGKMYVNGIAASGTVSADGQVIVFDGGKANEFKVSKGGAMLVKENGTANDATVISAGLHVSQGGVANAAVIKTEGLMVVSNGGKASNTVVSSGSISVLAGGEVKDTDVKDQGILTVEKDGTADKTTVWEGGSMTLRGTANETAVLYNGQMTVSGGATATKTTVADHGTMTLEMGGSAIEATVYDGGALFVNGGGTATHTVLDEGAMYVSGGGIADGVSVESGGFLYLYKGAQATVVRESGGFVQTEAGANISFAKTTFTGLTITGDSATVHSNTKAVDITLADNGRLYIHSGGTAAGTVVNNVGRFYLYSGGVASGATVNAGGSMTISSGAKATGKLTFAEGAVVSAYEGAKIDFDISGLSPDNAVLVKNLSLVTGSPDFTLTVGTQELGTYRLADGVTSFDGTITVVCNDYLLGTISVGEGRKTVETMDYTLTLDGGVLSVTLEEVGEDTTPPTITDITLSTLEPGVASVTVTAVFADNVSLATKQYRIGAGDWQDYTDAGVTVTRNTTVYFKATDTAGNEATGSCTVSNIAGDPPDITPPVVSNVAADITVPTTGSVTVTADFSDDVELKSRLYRLGGGEWTDYPEGGVAVMENGPVYFKAVDADGNESEVEDIVISNIDKKPPTITDFTLSTYAPAESVTVTAAFKDDVALASREYRIGDGEWLDYTTGVTVTQNAVLAFRAADAVGNETVEHFAVTNIGTGAVDFTGGLDESHDLKADEVASGVNINDGGILYVSSGAIALETNVNSGGHLSIDEGGIADVVTVNPGGELYVYSGGAALKIRENGGYVDVRDGATAAFVPNAFTGLTLAGGKFATVHSGTTATDITVNQGGYFFVYAGGSATGIVAAEGAYLLLTVAPGTYQQGTYAGNAFEVAGGDVTGYAVHSGCQLYVSGGGVATDTTVEDGGWLRVLSGGTATGGTVASGGHLVVSDGGYAAGIAAADGAVLYLAIAADTYQQGTYAGSAFAFSSAVTGITLQPHVNLEIGSGGTATGIGIGSGLRLDVSSGGTATEVTVEHGGTLNIYSGGTATVTENGGNVRVYNGADVTFVPNTITGLVFSDIATIHSGTTAIHTTMVTGGPLFVYSGGIVSDTTINAGTVMLEGGVATDTTVNDGTLQINSGAGTGTTVNSGGTLDLYKHNNIACDTTVNAGGRLYVTPGNTVNGLVVNSGGSAVLMGTLTGKAVFETGAIVMMSAQPTVDFDLTQTTPDADPLVNDLSFVMDPSTIYTLTVDGTVVNGTYSLAGGATGFDKTITVNNTLGEGIGTLSVGDVEKEIVGMQFSLALNGSDLTVTVAGGNAPDTTAPTVSNIQASITTPTNQNVTVTADFDDDVALKSRLYRLEGDSDWSAYPEGGVVVTENTTVYFKAVDTSGNECKPKFITIDNIDKVAPTITNITPSTTAPATSVTVTAVFDDDVELSTTLYRIGDGGWFNYNPEGVTVTTNTTVYFKATDTAGNATTASYDVTNIETSEPDTTPPTVTNIAASTTALTNNNVFVTADFLDNVAVKSKLYKLGSGAWTAYVDGVVVTENATVYFKAVDTSDNESDVAEYAVTNIDKVAPTITNITHSPTAPAKSVTVTATFADNIGLATKQYKIGTSGAWTDYVDGVIMTENGTVYFWAVDTAGNESSTVSHTVTNIEPTGSSITGDITGETKDVPAGWTALNVNVNTGGKLNVLDGGVASNTNVNAGGRLYVSSGGIARDTTVNDGGLIEGSGCEIDGIVVNSGGSLLLYSGAKLTGQMTFASGAEVIPFVGSILDFDLTQTEPGSPALVNDLSILMGTPTYTITVDNSQALGTYKLAGGAAGFDKPITVRSIYGEIGCTLTVDGGATKLGDVYLTLALSGSDLTFTISEDSGGGIIPDNKPDDGKNDYLYKKKADPEWNNANIHVTNEITGNGEVRLDLPGTIDTEDGKHNLFGHDKDNMDTGDVAQVEVNDPAKLTFTIDSNAAGTFFVYEDGFDKKGNRKMITVKKVTVKAGKLATLKDVCLTSTGKYYVAMTAKNVKKVGIEGLYNVNVIESKFFVDADEGANKNNTADEGKTISVGRDQDKNIVLDGNPMKGSTEFNSFVGFTDGKDYAKLDLTDSAYLKFHVTGDGDGKAKFTIWKQTKGTTGKLSKVTSVSLPAKKVYDATTKAQFLDTSKYTYYVSMECSDEAKGKGVYYNVQITDDAVFFDSNDDGKNNILYDKKAKSFYVEDANHHFESTTIGTETKVKLDTNPVADTDWENFVGYQDATDYAKIELTSDGKLNFHLEATGDATFTVYKKGQDKKGNDTLETIQTAKLAVASGASKTEKDIQISDLEAGEYYVSMAAKSTKANSTGSVFYNVTATLDAVVTSALEMPMAAAAYADSVQDKLFGESGNGLLASL